MLHIKVRVRGVVPLEPRVGNDVCVGVAHDFLSEDIGAVVCQNGDIVSVY